MSAVYRHGQKYGMIPRGEEFNPMKLVSCSTVSDYEAVTVTPQQAFAIVEGVGDPLVRTLLILIASTAMRVSEALALAWSDIDWKKCQINIRRAWVHSRFGPPKSKSSKAPVPLHQTVAATLQAWRMETSYAQDDDLLFTSSGKTPRLASMLVEDYVRPAAIAAGVIPKHCPRFGFHNLRHSLCTFLLEAEHDPLVVQRLLRHSDVKMTMQYGHLDGMRRKMQDEFMQEFMPTGSEAGSVQ